MTTLVVSGLHTYYAKSHILHDVGFEVREGEIVALLGRNGAGKTTTLRSVMGLTPARSGTIRIFDQETTDWPPFRIAALGVGYVPEGRRIFSNLTVEENLAVPLERPGPWNIARIYELFPRLAERRSNRGGQLSGGEQEMLAIGRALLLNPKTSRARRAIARPGAAHRAPGLRGGRLDAQGRYRRAAGRAECACRDRDR